MRWGRGARRRLLTVVAICGMAAAFVLPVQEASAAYQAPTYQRTIGHPGHAGVYAWGMATGTDGTIYVGDYVNYTVRQYTTSGTLIRSIGTRGSGPGKLGIPYSIAISPTDGSLWIADRDQGEMEHFTSTGAYLGTLPAYVFGATIPYAYSAWIAVNSRGQLIQVNSHVLPDDFEHRILVRNPDGSLVRAFGSRGTGNGQFGVLHGVAVGRNDDIYVVDQGNHRVQQFRSDGTFVRAFSEGGTGPGRIPGDARGITVDRDNGWVYVVDSAESQIEKFDLNGNYLTTWGVEGSDPGQFRDGGRQVTIGADHNVYVADYGNFRVNVYTPKGTFLRTIPNPAPGPPDGGFNQASDVAVRNATGDVYVTDTFNHRVQRFDAAGDFVQAWGFRGTTDPMAMNYPRGVAVDQSTGNVWINNTRQGNIKGYTADGAFIRSFGSWGTGASQLQYAYGIGIDQSGRLLVPDSRNGRIKVTTQTGTNIWIKSCGSAGSGILVGCTSAVADSDGNVYATAVTRNVVYKFSPNGTLLKTFGSGLGSPYGATILNGILYVSEMSRNRISAFDLDGNLQGRFGTTGEDHGQFSKPMGLASDSSGNLYVMDQGNERLEVYHLG